LSEPPGDSPGEPSSAPFRTPEDAEAAFYEAIERADIDALERVWSVDDAIVCIHPGTERIEGRWNVLESFRQMFDDAPALDFRIVDTLATGNDGIAVHLVRERIALDGELVSVMVATNVYQIENGGWRMLLHHASPEPDAALDAASDTIGDDTAFDPDDEEPGEWPGPPPVLH